MSPLCWWGGWWAALGAQQKPLPRVSGWGVPGRVVLKCTRIGTSSCPLGLACSPAPPCSPSPLSVYSHTTRQAHPGLRAFACASSLSERPCALCGCLLACTIQRSWHEVIFSGKPSPSSLGQAPTPHHSVQI